MNAKNDAPKTTVTGNKRWDWGKASMHSSSLPAKQPMTHVRRMNITGTPGKLRVHQSFR